MVDGFDNVNDYRKTRSLIGLVPQELTIGAFETVIDTVTFSRGLFGKSKNPAYLQKILEDLSLWDKKDNQLRMLSGGMKRRVLIAKALSHEPKILFLDEPSAGVDVELRKDMWKLIKKLRDDGVTIILTTHYIEEAEEIADRIGVINNGQILLVEDKAELMQKLGKKQLIIEIKEPIQNIPESLTSYAIELDATGTSLIYTYDTKGDGTGITELLQRINQSGLSLKDIKTTQSSLDAEMARAFKTLFQTMASPVISTSLYFIVFGSAIGSRIESIEGVSYGLFIVPGLTMLTLLTQSISNASFGIYFPKFTGTIYEILSAPISFWEALIGYVGAAASKSFIIGIIILLTANLFVDLRIQHPIWMMTFLILTCISFSLFGFIIGLWADSFEKLQVIPILVITPLVFLGGSFYSINMLPPFWQTVTLFNPVVYLVSGFRWSFFEVSDVNVWTSLIMILVFLSLCLIAVAWIFKTGYKLKD